MDAPSDDFSCALPSVYGALGQSIWFLACQDEPRGAHAMPEACDHCLLTNIPRLQPLPTPLPMKTHGGNVSKNRCIPPSTTQSCIHIIPDARMRTPPIGARSRAGMFYGCTQWRMMHNQMWPCTSVTHVMPCLMRQSNLYMYYGVDVVRLFCYCGVRGSLLRG